MKIFMGKFFQQCNNILARRIRKQPDNESDRYAAKCKHRLGSKHTSV